MKLELTVDEYKDLKTMHKKTKDGRERDKIKAIIMLSDSYSLKEVAKVLLLDEDTISRWRDCFLNRKELTDWLEYKYVGNNGKLNEAEEMTVETYLNQRVISNSKQARVFIREQFGKAYSKSGAVELLHRLGFVYKLTTLIPSKYDAKKQADFKEKYETLEKNLKEDEEILCLDGVHPQHNTSCTRAWIKKGETKEIKSNTGRQRINICGAYNPNTQEVIMHEVDTINADSFIDMLKKIEVYYPDKSRIYGILDNARYHRNEKVTEYLKTSKIVLEFLPAYSPNLNLIERLWKYMRKKIINNRYYEKFLDFRKALIEFFKNLPNESAEVKKFIGTKLHLLQAV